MQNKFYILLTLLLFCIFATPAADASEINLSRSKLIQLALHLEVADQQLQYDFSRIAIIEMFNTYEQELHRSQTHLTKLSSKRAKKKAKIRGWQIATRTYLKTLDQYLFSMDSGVPLEFLISRQNKIIILIGEQPVIISGPNSGSDKQIEHNIVEQFCLQYDCREYFQETSYITDESSVKTSLEPEVGESSVEKSSVENYIDSYSETSGSWTIHSDLKADFITGNGLIFKFSNIKNRFLKEAWAIGISRELTQLIEYLRITQQKGHKIQWSSLSMHELPLTDSAYKIIVNKDGDYIKMSLPLLGKNPALFIQLIPWSQSYFENKTDYRMIIKKADGYFNNREV